MKKLFVFICILLTLTVLTAQSIQQHPQGKIEKEKAIEKSELPSRLNTSQKEAGLTHSEVNPVSNLQVFPNPAVDYLNVEFKITLVKSVTISIVNQIGQIIHNEEIEITASGSVKEKLDISKIPPGIYFLNLKSDPANQITKRIVIK